ncbi:class I SAM-dependent methyltransferase [Zhongshania aliphaticivorans]|uniref:class I SAM-dependent methyltransferase n=1 Tax=Zhongshania aliphaticivorans TaxID=1470434 RepID=UPI0013302251|nr:class I SAM-dependent methyltransferase [Zhongshania aliphaticivorans]
MSDFAEFARLSGFSSWDMETARGAQRLFHGRGQCYAGFEFFTVDYYEPVLWIVLYKEPGQEFWQDFCAALENRFKNHCTAAVVQRRYEKPASATILWGLVPEKMAAIEGDCRFKLELANNQNIGYFMDMEPTRRWLSKRASGARVLNLFSYTCAFSVAAEQAGAVSIVNIDTSKSALARGRENHNLNPSSQPAVVKFLSHDILKSWGRLKKLGPYDIVICDPPSRQVGSFDAVRDYKKLVRQFPALLPLGGDVLVCLNAPYLGQGFLEETMQTYCPSATFIARIAGREDFPELNLDAALKVLHYRL